MNMKKMNYFHLKNDMVGVNLLANMAGSFAAEIMTRVMIPGAMITSAKALRVVDHLFTPGAILFLVLAMVLYERPIRKCLKSMHKNTSISDSDWEKARRRLLNEPFLSLSLTAFAGLSVRLSMDLPSKSVPAPPVWPGSP